MTIDQFKLLDWLSECNGDEIWTREYCNTRGIPDYLIDTLIDGFESGYNDDSQTIYFDDKPVTQFEGIRDVDLAIWIGKQLKVDTCRILNRSLSRGEVVRAIKEEFEEG